MVIIIDYGTGNTASILNMLEKAGCENVKVSSMLKDIEEADALILPGVGSFDNGMEKLNSKELLELLHRKVIVENTPFLGICLGMQLLFENSEEGKLEGLGWLKGSVRKFDFSMIDIDQQLKIPHMGWNLVQPCSDFGLFENIEEPRYYFVHSFHVDCVDKSDTYASSFYGYKFTCAVQKNNIWGVQFHPEKSHKFGLQFFKNFLGIIDA